MENAMRHLKNQLQEFDELLELHRGQLDTDVLVTMKLALDRMKQEVDLADAAQQRQIASEVLKLLASLLSVVTNVMTLWK